MNLVYEPIAIFKSSHNHTYEAPRQGVLASGSVGLIKLDSRFSKLVCEDLIGFDRIWLIYDFHKNKTWKEKVRPPRLSEKKRSVFSTRSPYRPNSIGISCVKLDRVDGVNIFVSDHDLLDETPILDIKPYLPYSDSFNEAETGWLKNEEPLKIKFSLKVREKIDWIERETGLQLFQILKNQLSYEPTNNKCKRVKWLKDEFYIFSVRTWKFKFSFKENVVEILSVFSSYDDEELENENDVYGDKSIHINFNEITF